MYVPLSVVAVGKAFVDAQTKARDVMIARLRGAIATAIQTSDALTIVRGVCHEEIQRASV